MIVYLKLYLQFLQGSPLVQSNQIIGMMSKNLGCLAPYAPSVFTRNNAMIFLLYLLYKNC